MKICRIIYTYSPYQVGGGDIYAAKISRALATNGHKEVIISISQSHKDIIEENGNVKIYRFPPANVSALHMIAKRHLLLQGIWTLLDIYSPYAYYKILSVLKKEIPDVVHIHTPIDLTLAVFDAVANVGLPMVLTIHDYIFLCRRFVLLHSNGDICTESNINPFCRIYRQFCRSILNNKVDMVISPSQFSLELYKLNGFFRNTQGRILPHGIDVNIPDYPRNVENIRKKDKILNILYAGGLTKHKGVHVLINAFKIIKNQNLRLHIVGGGAYDKRLKNLADNDGRIVFHGKFLNNDMQKFYYDSDVLVVPSIWYEVRSNVIPEAFRAGIPVIGSKIGAIPEFVRDNYNGFLFNPGDEIQLKEILENIAASPDKLKTLGKNAREYVKEFEMNNYINNLTAIYKEAIEINKRKNKTL